MIRGCVPKKLLVYASGFRRRLRGRRGLRLDASSAPRFDWAALIAAKDAEIARLEAAYHDRLRRGGRAALRRRARRSPTRTGVRLATGAEYSAKHLLIATGGRPVVPDLPGAELGITSNEMFELETPAEAHADRRRRLCRLRVRRHHERPRHRR